MTPETPVRRPASERVAFLLATWFGCGRIPKAPGTWGTFGAVPLYLLLARAEEPARPLLVLAAAAVITLVGVWASRIVCDRLGVKDAQIICIDEVAGVLITLAPARGWLAVGVGVALFRLLDVLKPWPARAFERRLPGGWGVMLDDVAAGAWGAALLLLGRRLGLF